jgi:hypothetical protein
MRGEAQFTDARENQKQVTFQMAEVAVPRELFQKILRLIDDLRRRSVPT